MLSTATALSTRCKRSRCDMLDVSLKNLAFSKTAHSNNRTREKNMSGAGPSKAVEVHKQKLATITVDMALLTTYPRERKSHVHTMCM